MTRNILQCLDEVERWLARHPRRLYCSDYDGTLASAVEHPGDACLQPRRREMLAALARQPGIHVAIVSSRGLDDVRRRVELPDVICAGNHGMEIAGPMFSYLVPDAANHRRALRDLCRDLAEHLSPWPGIEIEYKGLSATIHYRRATPHDWFSAAQVVQMAVLAYGELFWIARGNQVYDIRPRLEWNKGSAVRWLAQKLDLPEQAVLCLGDDRTDEDAFTALPSAVTVQVGGSDSTAARWHLPDDHAVEVLLSYLARPAGGGTRRKGMGSEESGGQESGIRGQGSALRREDEG